MPRLRMYPRVTVRGSPARRSRCSPAGEGLPERRRSDHDEAPAQQLGRALPLEPPPDLVYASRDGPRGTGRGFVTRVGKSGWRDGDDWSATVHDPGDRARLPSIDCELEVDELYDEAGLS